MKIKGPATHQPQSPAPPIASPKDLSTTHSNWIRIITWESRNAQRVAKAFKTLLDFRPRVRVWRPWVRVTKALGFSLGLLLRDLHSGQGWGLNSPLRLRDSAFGIQERLQGSVVGLVKAPGKGTRYRLAFCCLVYIRETTFVRHSYTAFAIQSDFLISICDLDSILISFSIFTLVKFVVLIPMMVYLYFSLQFVNCWEVLQSHNWKRSQDMLPVMLIETWYGTVHTNCISCLLPAKGAI